MNVLDLAHGPDVPGSDVHGVDALAGDGSVVHLRDLTPADRDAVAALHRRASDRSLRLRFFGGGREGAVRYAADLLTPAGDGHRAVGALARGRLLGMGVLERVDPATAEFALLVADDRQHHGIGTLLLEQLVAEARGAGLHRLTGTVLAENVDMITVIADLGLPHTMHGGRGELDVVIDLDDDAAMQRAAAERDREAQTASLRALFSPDSVAVVGASERPGSVGGAVLANLLAAGFGGSVQAVNPHRTEVLGVPCVASVRDLPVRPDLVVIAVPAPAVEQVVRDCGHRGARVVVVLSSGFAESGPQGRARQRAVWRAAREHGLRLVGPNCLGVLNTDPAVRLDATFGAFARQPGRVAVLSQSGAVAAALTLAAERTGCGVARLLSIGDRADVGANDVLPVWRDDPQVGAIALYLESVDDARRFARVARAAAEVTPVLALKAGRTDAGRRAGRSHTGAAASSDAVTDALLRSSGVLRVDTLTQLLDAARLFAGQPLPRGPQLAVVGNSGGPEILATDAAAQHGLQPAEFDATTRQALQAIGATGANPVDLGAQVTPDTFTAAVRLLLESPSVDMVLAVVTGVAVTDTADALAGLADLGRAAHDTATPLVAVSTGAPDTTLPVPGSHAAVPVYSAPEAAAAALGLAWRHAAWRAAADRPTARPDGIDRRAGRALVHAALDGGGRWLEAGEVAALLGAYGVTTCPQQVVGNPDAAAAAAERLGLPAVVKLAEAGAHKSERGGVRLDLRDADEVRAAAAALQQLDGRGGIARSPVPLLVQPLVSGAAEFIVGGINDAEVGPVVMLGAGGILTDLLDDRGFRLAPVTQAEADELVARLRVSRLLAGVRGRPAASPAAVADLVHRVSTLLADRPEIAELDLNPAVARGEEVVVVDARVRVAPPPAHPDPLVRRLRGPLAEPAS